MRAGEPTSTPCGRSCEAAKPEPACPKRSDMVCPTGRPHIHFEGALKPLCQSCQSLAVGHQPPAVLWLCGVSTLWLFSGPTALASLLG